MFSRFRSKIRVRVNRRHGYSFKGRTDWFSIKHADWTWLSNRSQFMILKTNIWKLFILFLFLLQNFPRKFLSCQKMGIYLLHKKNCWWIRIKISSDYSGKQLSFVVLNGQKANFYAIYEDFGIFSIFIFSNWSRSKSVLWSFLRSWRNYHPKIRITPPKLFF